MLILPTQNHQQRHVQFENHLFEEKVISETFFFSDVFLFGLEDKKMHLCGDPGSIINADQENLA